MYENIQLVTVSNSNEDKKKVDFSQIICKSTNDTILIHYLNQKEEFKKSVKKIMISSNPVTRVEKYKQALIEEKMDHHKTGLYIIDSDLEKTNFLHKNHLIDKLLDYDYIDTENTDYSYLKEEESISEEANCSLDFSDNVSITSDQSDGFSAITFNGKKLSMYETEILTESITAPEST
mmetsp:Transcript_7582/g.8625  ORF Transcript_7582/g.8625 Transcript_7582/m.8625 type:complete len:178 (+) Transcript_7582:183-716(+)